MQAWWKEQVAYQIYPRSFMDSNNDGVGDIRGIIRKLDHLQRLGVTIVWLSPVFTSPQKDYGYDVADYCDIDPMYGTLEDMDALIQAAKQRGIQLIMDLVMNHTSDQHEWFQKSRQRIEPYTDYYIWKDGQNGGPPNNWTSIFTGSAWQYDTVRQQYYLHLFAVEQPDLNFHNDAVIEEIKTVMRFWLDRGVYGFRYDAINVIYKSSFEDGDATHFFKGQEHYLAQAENHTILHELYRDVLSQYDTFTVGETGDVEPDVARLFCDPERQELDALFTFEHMHTNSRFRWIKTRFKPKPFFEALIKWQEELPWNTVFFENHDLVRSVSQFGKDKRYWYESATALAMLLLTLRGTPFIYQGQEIGMTNFDYQGISDTEDIESHRLDRLMKRYGFPRWLRWRWIKKVSRDNARTPMQWDATMHAGFTKGTPWLAVPKNYTRINVMHQEQDPRSILSFYQRLIALRQRDQTLIHGTFEPVVVTKHMFGYRRVGSDTTYLVLVNLSGRIVSHSIAGTLVMGNYHTPVRPGTLRAYEAILLKQ